MGECNMAYPVLNHDIQATILAIIAERHWVTSYCETDVKWDIKHCAHKKSQREYLTRTITDNNRALIEIQKMATSYSEDVERAMSLWKNDCDTLHTLYANHYGPQA